MGLLWPGLPSGASVGAPVRTPSPPPAGMSRVPSQLGSARSPRSRSRGPLTRPQAPSARWSKSGWPARVSLPARPMAQDRQAAYANRRRSNVTFATGDFVLVDRDFFAVHRKLPHKFAPRRVGPFKVLDSPGPNAYRLDFPDGYDHYHPVVNVNFLTLYRTAEGARVRTPPPPPHLVNNHIEYEVETILDHKPRTDDRGRALYDPDGSPHLQYLVRWKGHDPSEDSWEPLNHFTRCHKKVEEYRESHGLPPLPPKGTTPRVHP
eukprot:jgi/Botrbrau1/20259/Bobra.31_1s0044.1